MPRQTIELIKELREAKNKLTELRAKTTDLQERKAITQQKRDMDKQINRLRQLNIDQAGLAYKKATRAIIDANGSLRKALADLAKVSTAVNGVAKAMNLVTAVVGA